MFNFGIFTQTILLVSLKACEALQNNRNNFNHVIARKHDLSIFAKSDNLAESFTFQLPSQGEIQLRLPYFVSGENSVKFPAAESELKQLSSQISEIITSWGLLGKDYSGPEWLSWFDISSLPGLPTEVHKTLHDLPVWLRLSTGLVSLEVIPFLLDLLIFSSLWRVFTRKPDARAINTLPKTYDIDTITRFYSEYPGLVLGRMLDIFDIAKSFLFDLASDKVNNKLTENASIRAIKLRELVAVLGPTAIKIGQATSVRPDLLPQAYIQELAKLQDQVPPFDSKVAVQIIESSLNRKVDDIFLDAKETFSRPIAAASLGQVYKGVLSSTGESCAVKVQRPGMKLSVTLDLFVIRLLLVLGAQYIPSIRDECLGFIMVVDNWAGRFVDELDYEREVENCELFRKQMVESETSLGDVVVVPRVYKDLCSESVLVSEWIDGTKLSKIDVNTSEGKTTVRQLTQVLLNCYLVQLLETGFLHGDPHPGNFLVTNEGRLCILDYGLMTTVDADKRIALVEYISHLLAKDYDATLDDLIVLEFIPKEISEDDEKRKIVAPMLAQVLTQLSAGGGAKSLNVDEVGRQIEGLSEQYPIIIPAYFGLIVRAFGALEGLGLSVDENYSITTSCFPYLAKRLLSDDSERIRMALRTFLYGQESRLNLKRLDQLAEGYRAFTTVSADASSGKAFESLKFNVAPDSSQKKTYSLETDPVLSSLVKILFSSQGNYVQELLLDEAVRITDALSRSVITTALAIPDILLNPSSHQFARSSLAVGSSRGRQILSSVIRPLTALNNLSQKLEDIFKPSEEDVESLRTLKRLLQILAGGQLVRDSSLTTSASTNSSEESSKSTTLSDSYELRPSSGLIDTDDIELVRQVVSNISASLVNIGQSTNREIDVADPLQANQRRARRLSLIRSQLTQVLPLVRQSAPGARKLGILFMRKFVSRSLNRIADKLES